jgi:hypothetical protein
MSVQDQAELNKLVDDALNNGADKVGPVVYRELQSLAAMSGTGQWADRALKVLTVERLDVWGKERQRELGSMVDIGGKKVFISDVRSHRVRVYDRDGVVFAWQHEMWWEVSWDVLGQMIQILAAQQAVADEKLAAMRRGYALKDDYPQAKNVDEACSLLGQTVEEFLGSAP